MPNAGRGDLQGGVVSAVLGLPESMAYGALVFAPLGPAYVPLGVVAGLIGLCFANLVPGLYGRGVPLMNSGPFSMSSLMLAALLSQRIEGLPESTRVAVAVVTLYAAVILAGVLQVLFGLLRAGELAKYIPRPVIAGLLNGTAVLIGVAQFQPMLGLPRDVWTDPAAVVGHAQPVTLVLGLAGVLVVWHGQRISRRIPEPFLGLLVVTAAYHAVRLVAPGVRLGPTIGAIPMTWPTPGPVLTALGGATERAGELLLLLPAALALALVVSLRTLIAGVSVDNRTRETSDGNRELIAQGLGNLVAGLFGGITSAGSVSRSLANHTYGAATARVRVVTGLSALLVLVLLGPLLAIVPVVGLASLLVVLALKSFDGWSQGLLRTALRGRAPLDMRVDLAIVGMVTACLVFVGVFESLALGVALALVALVFRLGRDIVRREMQVGQVFSNVHRSDPEIAHLLEHGHAIRVLELEGALFFGTADQLGRRVDAILEGPTQTVVLDMHYVTHVDSTGASIVVRAVERAEGRGRAIGLSGLDLRDPTDPFVTALGTTTGLRPERCFLSIDDAVAWAEDRLLDARFGASRHETEIDLGDVESLRELSADDREAVRKALRREEYRDGEEIFAQGSPGDRMYFIVAGRADVSARGAAGSPGQKLATLSPGTLFGELALLDGRPRSAGAVARGRLVCYSLGVADIVRLSRERPTVGPGLLSGLSREMARRLRIATRVFTELNG